LLGEFLRLKVKLPFVIEVDNKGAVDLANSWTATGRTRHIATRINFLRELKEQGLISINWISNVWMSSDIFTKNVGGKDFYKHRDVYVREDPSVPCVEAPTTTTYPVGEGVGACSPSADSGGDIEGDPGLEQKTGSVVEHVIGADADVIRQCLKCTTMTIPLVIGCFHFGGGVMVSTVILELNWFIEWTDIFNVF
jgi:hypothetical protein